MTFADLIYKFFAYIYNNKQSILGGCVAALAFLQTNDAFKTLLEPKTYEIVMLVVGLVMVLFARSTSGGIVSKLLPGSIPKDLPPKEGT